MMNLSERQELYETKFRHEEEVDDRVMGHSRKVEGSVRKKENARKEQRMKIAELERQEELKHLKNLKKKEMKERMKKVMAIAGFKEDEDLPLNLKDLDDKFDPDEYDKMMKAVFGDKYYDTADVDPEFGFDREGDEDEIEKLDFDKEDELLGLPKGWDVIKSGDGFKAARERSLKHKLEISDDDDDSEREEEEDSADDDEGRKGGGEKENEVHEEIKWKRKRKMPLVRRAKEEMLEEFYKLDYEDTIGDLKTRFKNAKVKPNRYGLKTKEILVLDDNELNQYVSVKKLAPYREKEWKVPDVLRYQQKLKTKELLQGQKSDDHKMGKRKRSKSNAEESTSEIGAKRAEKAQLQEPVTDIGNLSKRAKTRRRQVKPKLSQSRLVAYGKIPSKSKIGSYYTSSVGSYVVGETFLVGGGGGCDLVDGEDLEVGGGGDGPTNGIVNRIRILRGTFFCRSLISLVGNAIVGTPPSCDATVVGSKVTSNGTNNCIPSKADQRSTKECSSKNAHPIDCSKMQSGSSFPPQSMKRPPVPKPQVAKPSHSPIPFVGPSPPPPTSKSSPSTRSQPPPPPTKRVSPTTQLPTDEAQN
ncbi:hypothetical protein EZV62_000264 [Acer yangbiense]|uniref:Kri1-like C-terminal domain-containing protein n=1 Tax=Acer yangbiense TaxID=1000413 RepID=A0A5C7IR06_9ROSI|nr:hypothetical protein EZV62_000264 [Acer yangbiense]